MTAMTATPAEQARNRRSTKLTLEKAREIRRQALAGESPTAIARRYGIGDSIVRNIKKGASWTEDEP